MDFRLLTKKRTTAFALLGLLLIISMVITSTVEGQSLNDEEITETIVVASSEFEDTVGDGVDDGTQEQDSTPTPDPSDEPGDEEDDNESEGGEETETPTEEPTADPTTDGDDSEEDSDGEDSEDSGSEEDGSEEDDPENDASEEYGSEEDADGEDSEDSGSEEDGSEEDNPEDDASEEDDSEEDADGEDSEDSDSEEDSSEEDDPEGDASEEDDSEEDADGKDSEDSGSEEDGSEEDDPEGDASEEDNSEEDTDGEASEEDGSEEDADEEDDPEEEDSEEGTDGIELGIEENASAVSLGVEVEEDRGLGITIEVTCVSEGSSLKHKWTVKNNYLTTRIRFKWSSNTGESNNSWQELEAGQSKTFYTSASAQTLTVEYQYRYWLFKWRWSSSETETKSHEACDAIDLSLDIKNVDTTCFGVDVTVRVTNTNQYVNATNVVVNLDITHGSGFVSSSTTQSQTISSISKSSSSQVTFTIATNDNWINASSSDWIGFSASIASADQSDPNSGNNSDSDTAKNPGNCLPDLDISLVITSTTLCGNIDFEVSVTNKGKTEAVNVQVTNSITSHSNYVSSVNPSVFDFGSIAGDATETLTGTIVTSDDWMKVTGIAHFTIDAKITNEEANPNKNVGKHDSEKINNPGNCGPILDIWIEIATDELCGDIPFEVKIKNNGQTAAENVVVTNSVLFDGTHYDYVDHIGPETLNFGTIQPGDTVTKTATIYITDDWLNGYAYLSYIAIEAEITNEDVNPGFNEGKFEHESINNPGDCIIAPEVTTSCEVHEGVLQHKLTISNPNNFDIYIKLTGQSNFSKLSSGHSTVLYTDHTAQTVTLQYKKSSCGSCGGEVYSMDIEMGNCLVAPTLSASCSYNGSEYAHVWTLSNPNAVSLSYSWTGDSTPSSGSGTVNASGSANIYTKLDAQTMSLSYTYEGVTYSLDTQSAESCLVDLSLSYECQSDGQHKWTVKNNNVQTGVEFNWWTDPDVGSGDSISLNAGASTSFYTDSSAHTAYVSYTSAGETHTTEASADSCLLPLELENECTDSNQHEWTVTNPNAMSVSFTWWTDPDVGSGGPITLGVGGTTTFTTDNTAHTAYVSFTNDSVTYTTEDSAEACLVELSLGYECLENGQHEWTVTNDNGSAIDFTWSSTSGETGSGSVLANDTTTFTSDNTAQTMTVSYEFNGEDKSVSLEAEVCLIPLGVTYACDESTGDHIWTVTNDNGSDIVFTWVSTTGESGLGSVLANDTATFTSDNTAQTMTVTYEFNGDTTSDTTTAEACLIPLEIDYVCHEYNASHIWTVTNSNEFAIEFTWATEDGTQSGGPLTVAAGPGTTETFTTDSTAHKVIVSYEFDGEDKSVEKEAESCKSSDLTLTYLCGYTSDDNLYWSITNPYDVDLDVEWEVSGSPSDSGTVTALANSDTIFTTGKGNKTVIVSVDGYQVGQDDGGEACCVELTLNYQCLSSGGQIWTVTNPNSFNQAFTWVSTNGQSGSGTAPANGTTTFTTDNGVHTVTLTYQKDPSPEKTTSFDAEACKVSTDDEEEETTVVTTQTSTSLTESEESTCTEWIVFHSMRDGNLEIYRLDGVEGEEGYQLINLSQSSATDSNPSRSFDNEWVAFQSNRDGNYEIYVTDSLGSEQIRLTDNSANDINPMFSPDNTNIIFQSDRNGSWDLYMIDRTTGEEVQLTDSDADETNPFFPSENENFLVYESNQNGNQDIFLLNIVTGNEYHITNGAEDEVSPILSPSGLKVAYLSPIDGVWNLFIVGIDGSNMIQITDGDGDTTNPAWSPDGTKIAYQSERDGNIDIYVYDLEESIEYRLTDNAGPDTAPSWDCGGTYISYTTKEKSWQTTDIYKVFWQGGESSFLTDHPSTDRWSEGTPAKEIGSRDE